MKDQIYQELVSEMWELGELDYKLKPHQAVLYSNIVNSTSLKYVVNCCRRFGKSFVLTLIAIEYALRNPKSHIRFAAPTQKQLKEIIQPIFDKIAKDAPGHIQPIWKQMDSYYYFPHNGSYLHVAGCNEGGMENLRGHESHLNIVDEAGSIVQLDYLIKDILLPQTLTTGGKTFIASTPAKTPAHYFRQLCDEAKLTGSYTKFTIDDNSSLDPDIVELYAQESGGRNSTTWKREYLCEFVVDESIVVIPEWESDYVKDSPRDEYYQFYKVYEAMDIGGRDKTVILYGYYDFKRAKLVVEYESVLTGQQTTTKLIAETVKDIESRYYANKKPIRVADNNSVLTLQSMGNDYGVSFTPTSKDRLKGDDILDNSMVNKARIFVGSGYLEVHPRCKELIGNLESAIWDTARKKFERTEIFGHFDALAALIYLIRNVDVTTNPIPTLYDISQPHNWHGVERLEQTQNKAKLKKLFGR